MTPSLFSLKDKVALIVGGAGYLGSAVSRAMAEHGAYVAIADLMADRADEISDALTTDGLSAEAVALDVGDEPAVVEAIDSLVGRHGRLDVLVNATYGTAGKPMEELTLDDWQQATRIGLGAAFVLAREAARVMAPRKTGSIIQFSSMYALVSPDPRIYAPPMAVNPIEYGVAKAGILQMVRYQAVMWAPHGVRVNAVVPGPFPAPGGNGSDEEFVARLVEKVPLGRVGRANEIVGAVVFLASDAAGYVTGTHLVVDGGWTAW